MNGYAKTHAIMEEFSKKYHIDNVCVANEKRTDEYAFFVRSYDEDFLDSLPEEYEGYLVIKFLISDWIG